MKSQYYGVWLTTNRACNLRCKWCYAYDTGFCANDELDYSQALKIIDFCYELGVKRVILIGGEPTIYSHIFDVVKYIKEKGMRPVIVSNGIILSDKNILNKFVEAGLHGFSISVKANSKDEYFETTGFDCFNKLISALDNLSEIKFNYSVSQVLTKDNMPTFVDGIKICKQHGAKNFSFGFCYNFNCHNLNNDDFIKNNNPYELAYLFKKYYSEYDKALEGCKFSLSQGLPLCAWDDDVIDEMEKKGQISSICQLVAGGGLLFDTDGSLIPCNAMYELKYGKFGVDFDNVQSFLKFMSKPKVREMYDKLTGIPDKKCLDCEKASKCGGGCVTNWTNYCFSDFEGKIKDSFLEKCK